MRKLPSRSVDVRYFFPVRELDALMRTPGRGVLPDFTTPVSSPKGGDGGLEDACGDGLACCGAGAVVVTFCASCSCTAHSVAGKSNTARTTKKDQTQADDERGCIARSVRRTR